MTTTTPRQRLAEAVAALDALAGTGDDDERRARGCPFVVMADALTPGAFRAIAETLAAARALLAALDEEAELAAVKALLAWAGMTEPNETRHVSLDEDGLYAAHAIVDGKVAVARVAPTAVALCARLNVEVK